MLTDTAWIAAARPPNPAEGLRIGHSREGRPIRAFRFGSGRRRVSLLGGCHADEPVGPALLQRLCGRLAALEPGHPLLRHFDWWIVPHVNPDGAERNRRWASIGRRFELGAYLAHVVRELPGDDIEFGFPRHPGDTGARPENRALAAWWRRAGGAFHLHVSLHGMGFSAGPWFLIDPGWIGRTEVLRRRLSEAVSAMGYRLHDVERDGEKGFVRIAPGFCTRPNHNAMREHFLRLGDEDCAGRFRPSSMEAVRALGDDTLTLVTEMPLFITPGVGETLGPPDPVAVRWTARLDRWRAALAAGRMSSAAVTEEGARLGIRPMPLEDQMKLQWMLVNAGLSTIREVGGW